MADIFISYSRQSETVVRALIGDIKALGHTAWFDDELTGGQAWWNQILTKVRDCDLFVFVLDPASLDSTACKREYGYAADLCKSILPVLVAEDVSTKLLPSALSQIQFVDYRKQDRDAALALARAIAAVPPSKPLPDPLPSRPEVPISYLGSLTKQVETTSTLSYEEQSVLVVDLKGSLRDPDTTNEVRALLERLRKRRDLLASIAEEIDELLERTGETPREPLGPSSLGQAQRLTADNIGAQHGDKDCEEVRRNEPELRMKLGLMILILIIGMYAVIGILLGINVGEISIYYHYKSRHVLHAETLELTLTGWTIASVISTWLWITARRAYKGHAKADRRFQFIFRGGVTPGVAYLSLSIVVIAFNIGMGITILICWSLSW